MLGFIRLGLTEHGLHCYELRSGKAIKIKKKHDKNISDTYGY